MVGSKAASGDIAATMGVPAGRVVGVLGDTAAITGVLGTAEAPVVSNAVGARAISSRRAS